MALGGKDCRTFKKYLHNILLIQKEKKFFWFMSKKLRGLFWFFPIPLAAKKLSLLAKNVLQNLLLHYLKNCKISDVKLSHN